MNGSMQSEHAKSCDFLIKLSGVRSSPKWSFKGKPNTDRRVLTPGPGEYSTTSMDSMKFSTSAKFGFGSSPRDLVRPATAPGPGEYQPTNPRFKNSSQYGFGKAERQGSKPQPQATPGPGAYQHQSKVGADGPKYAMSIRRAGNRAPDVPGPGAYHPPPRGTASDTSQSGMLPHAPVSPKWRFGTSPREGSMLNLTPGPGAYDTRPTGVLKSGPQFSMRVKHENRRLNDTPGPGAYGGALTQFGY
mmetsp:Transcript_45950/g.82867  ORF Transcript_45950/g.82867 Transcript_45950/m.82867 type:complete len:245 (-) Transcript_45950:260-994(-)